MKHFARSTGLLLLVAYCEVGHSTTGIESAGYFSIIVVFFVGLAGLLWLFLGLVRKIRRDRLKHNESDRE